MHAFTALIATEHLLDLRREAGAEHLANLARLAGSPDARSDGSLGRRVGRVARRLSLALDAFATRVDPIGARRVSRRGDGRGTRPLTA